MRTHIPLLLRVCIVGLLAVLAAFAATSFGPAHAANITVDTADDELNADGDCSLREAIEAANTDAAVDACAAGSGADTVTVPPGTYTITIAGADNTNAAGDFDILDDVTISGASAGSTIVDAGGLDRSFDVVNSADTVTISGMTIQNGDTSGSGGAVVNDGTLTVADSTLTGNTSSSDGGAVASSGQLTVTNSTLSGNTANTSGGIYFCASSTEPATISGTTISGNTVPGEGGAIWHECGGTMTITDSTLSGNTASSNDGGAIANEEELIISGTTISGNTAGADGGGIESFGDITITNSTISGNTAGAGGGGISNLGTVSLTNVTITGNTATGSGDGIYNPDGSVTVENTIIAANGDENCAGGAVTSAGYNLEDADDCGLAGAGDQTNTDPNLGSLADNGGPTETHALLAGSAAIDTASPGCPPPATDQRGVTRPVDGDEDGSAVCDIGAYEFQPAQPTPTATPAPTSPTATPTQAPEQLPETGASPGQDGSNGSALAVAAAVAALLGALATGAYALARRQRG